MPTVVFGDFEWDAKKAAENLAKHGVSFEEGASVFLDADYLILQDRGEPDRFIALGFSRLARMVFVVHVERGDRVRIISARRATMKERTTYEQRRQ